MSRTIVALNKPSPEQVILVAPSMWAGVIVQYIPITTSAEPLGLKGLIVERKAI